MTLGERFQRHLQTLDLPEATGLVAVSGGADSLALLHLLAEHRDVHRLRLVVAHVDHGIHSDSGSVAERVGVLAHALRLPFETTHLGLGPDASETAARRARWRWLFQVLDRHGPGVILTAHHRDDQVETVLMRVLAGSGPAGLTGMVSFTGREGRGGSPEIVRPLLPFSREEIREWVTERGLWHWEDPANRDPRHLRGWLRTEMVPRLQARFPDLDRRILALAAQAGLDRAAWDAALDALALDIRPEPRGISVASAPLRAYDTSLAQALLLAAARRAGCVIGPGRASTIMKMLARGRSGARVELGGQWVAEARFDRLAVVRHECTGEAWRVRLSGPRGEARAGSWRIRWAPSPAPGRLDRTAWTTWLTPGDYEVRPWRPGDRIRPLGGRGRRLVVRCMQDREVGRGDRPDWPVVTAGETVIWVPGVSRGEAAVPEEGMEAYRVDVDRG
jgi:tRNA(Ile)-lysidine synthase